MRIGFDVDGVIYRMTKAYHLWLNQSRGMSLDPELEAHTWDWYEDWETLEEFLTNLHAGVDAGVLFWKGELYEPTIPQNLRELRAAGHTIHVVTARFSGLVRSSEEATRHFFEKKDLIYDTLTLTKDKASVKTDLFIEDNYKNYLALEQAGVVSYLVNRPYNVGFPANRRVDTVDEFTGLILENAWQDLDYCSSY